MAHKKRRRPDSPGAGRPRSPGGEPLEEALFDPRMMESLMRGFLREQGLLEDDDSPESRAHDVLAAAFECGDPRQRRDLAEAALAVWPDCAEAYVLLGETAGSAEEAAGFYRQGVAAGERALGGPGGLAEYADRFWAALETRPYMRARLQLAQAAWRWANATRRSRTAKRSCR